MNGVLGGLEQGGNSRERLGEVGQRGRLRVWQGAANISNMLVRQLTEAVREAEPEAPLTPQTSPQLNLISSEQVFPVGNAPVAINQPAAAESIHALNPDVSRQAIADIFSKAA